MSDGYREKEEEARRLSALIEELKSELRGAQSYQYRNTVYEAALLLVLHVLDLKPERARYVGD